MVYVCQLSCELLAGVWAEAVESIVSSHVRKEMPEVSPEMFVFPWFGPIIISFWNEQRIESYLGVCDNMGVVECEVVIRELKKSGH